MRRVGLFFILLISFISSCIDPLDINIDKEVNVLIVEGSITTLPGLNAVRLTRSAQYGSIFDGFVKSVINASVRIRDSDGQVFVLSEAEGWPGIYFTDIDFLPEVGKTYTLFISTANGILYSSVPEQIVEAPVITNLDFEFYQFKISELHYGSGYNVYATFQDNANEDNYYMWKNYGKPQIISIPNYLNIELDCDDGKCWIRKSADRSVRLGNDRFLNGNLIKDHVAFITEDCVRFNTEYLVRVEHHSLSRRAYQYFKLLNDQISIDGDIFDPPPATIRGNIINLLDPDQNVIGYFRVSDVTVDSICIIN